MLALRILTAALAAPIVLAVVVVGSLPYLIMVMLAAGYGSYELLAMLRKVEFAPFGALTIGLAVALPALGWWGGVSLDLLAILLATVAALALAVRGASSRGPADWALTIAAAILIGGLLRCLVELRQRPDGIWWVLAVLLGTWACDTAAYAVGRLLGRTPLAPKVSPKKTVEGSIGAMAFTPLALVGVSVFAPVVGLVSPLSIVMSLVLGLLIALAAMLGDLAESLIKRQCGVKDSGTLLPGHGGLLDRIDGLLFAGLAGYGVSLVVR